MSEDTMARSRKQIGYVYFVRDAINDRVKIGYTSSLPTFRLTQLAVEQQKTLELIGIVVGSKVTERELHSEFDRHALGGEWFACSEAVTAFVAEIKYQGRPEIRELIGLCFCPDGRMRRAGQGSSST